MRNGEWQRCGDFSFWRTPQVELAGLTIGIIGYGRIGQRVGQIAAALGMNVVAYRRGLEVSEFVARADVLTLHTPLTPQSAGTIDRALLARMKSSALLINTARGGLVVEQDLADALNNDQITGAALDVVSIEPIRQDNPLLSAKNCILTPHMAWASFASRRRLMEMTAANIAAFARGNPINVVNS